MQTRKPNKHIKTPREEKMGSQDQRLINLGFKPLEEVVSPKIAKNIEKELENVAKDVFPLWEKNKKWRRDSAKAKICRL
jgi:hypothetical protein